MDFMDKIDLDKVMKQAKRAQKMAGKYDVDDMLTAIGLERRSVAADIVADIGFFALGAVCGALVGVFFAPRKGVELRENLKKSIGEKGFMGGISDTMNEQVGEA